MDSLHSHHCQNLERKAMVHDKTRCYSLRITYTTYKLIKLINKLFYSNCINLTIDAQDTERDVSILPSMYIGNMLAFYITSIIKTRDDEIQFEEAVESLIERTKPSTGESVTLHLKDYKLVIGVANNYSINENYHKHGVRLTQYAKTTHGDIQVSYIDIDYNHENGLLNMYLIYLTDSSQEEREVGRIIKEVIFKDRENRPDYYLNKLLQEKFKTDQLQSFKASWVKK